MRQLLLQGLRVHWCATHGTRRTPPRFFVRQVFRAQRRLNVFAKLVPVNRVVVHVNPRSCFTVLSPDHNVSDYVHSHYDGVARYEWILTRIATPSAHQWEQPLGGTTYVKTSPSAISNETAGPKNSFRSTAMNVGRNSASREPLLVGAKF